MNFIHAFINNFTEIFIGFFGSILPTATYLAATETSSLGTNSMDEHPMLGTTIVTAGSAVSSAVGDVKDIKIKQEHELSSAYVESMDIEELNAFISELEKIVEEKPKTLAKTLPKNI